MSEFAYFILGAVTGALVAIEATRHRWWSPGALQHYKQLQDKVVAWEIHDQYRDDPAFYRHIGLVLDGKVRDTVLEKAARIAETGCLVPPDGGSPTEDEREMCESIASAIRALKLFPVEGSR